LGQTILETPEGGDTLLTEQDAPLYERTGFPQAVQGKRGEN